MKNKQLEVVLPLTGINHDLSAKIWRVILDGVNSGINPNDVSRNLWQFLPSDFEWPEFDKWLAHFRNEGGWPRLPSQRYPVFRRGRRMQEPCRE